MLNPVVEEGAAVVTRGANTIGIVTTIDRSQGLAWVLWPDRCGLAKCQALECLQALCDRATVTEAIQVIASVQQLSSPLERAFLAGARSSASTQIVEADDPPIRPYYDPKGRSR